jgi:hypothetical protein
MSDSYPRLNSGQVVEHLQRDFDGVLGREDIRACVLTATSDLRGSICAEALNEMAYKLASYRLGKLASRTDTSSVDDLVGTARQ